jgi:hypothetical protein
MQVPAASSKIETIPWSDIGAKASVQYQGDALNVTRAGEGARLHCGFQKLDGEATREGLWLASTAENSLGERFRIVAGDLGRGAVPGSPLPASGSVNVADSLVRWARPGMTEEYSVSIDGLRQDFIIAERPSGTGPLRVGLALTGARAEAAAYGAKLTLEGSRRVLAYSRLRAIDATGKVLAAKIEVLATDRLAVFVEDAGAAYPLRIDPTFSDANWVSLNPGIPGANGAVYAAAVDANGNLYIGGTFTFVGTVAANNIAMWNGSSWAALGSGIGANGFTPAVYALALNGTTLYVGGNFRTAGGATANFIAQWNGGAWSTLGSGMNSTVFALAVSGSTLYAGGPFTTAGGVSANYVAQWNGSTWSALGSGMNNYTYALAVSGTNLYAGGTFTTAGGISVNYVAEWNGSTWSAVGSGMVTSNGGVYALAVNGATLYAGGYFAAAGGITASNIAQWNGSAWSALGSGATNTVAALAVGGSTLYAGGYFTNANGSPGNCVMQWNGSTWLALGSGTNNGIRALAVSGTTLFVGGQFTGAGAVGVNNLAQWDGNAWSSLGSGLSGGVSALAVSGSTLYIGGSFTSVGGVPAYNIAQWNGSTWSALGSGTDGNVYALAVSGSTLYAAGSFVLAGGTWVSFVAQWNGSTWSALGSGMNNYVFALAARGSTVYAGGNFTTAGGFPAEYIAQWNGSGWSPVGSGTNGQVNALAVSGTTLYAGGVFTTPGEYIAQWNGSAWSLLGSGVNNYVYALAVSGNTLYAGGTFSAAGGVSANYIAQWNGNSWSALGSGIGPTGPYAYNTYVGALAASGTALYAGGSFATAGGVTANNIAQWNGYAWSALGSGTNNPVSVLALNGTTLDLGGSFTSVGANTISPYLAEADLAAPTVITNTASLPANATTVVISGTGFDPQVGNDTVTFNDGAVGTVTAATSTALTVTFTTMPAGAGSLTAVITTDGYTSGNAVQVATVAPAVPAMPKWGWVVISAASLALAGFRLPRRRAASDS